MTELVARDVPVSPTYGVMTAVVAVRAADDPSRTIEIANDAAIPLVPATRPATGRLIPIAEIDWDVALTSPVRGLVSQRYAAVPDTATVWASKPDVRLICVVALDVAVLAPTRSVLCWSRVAMTMVTACVELVRPRVMVTATIEVESPCTVVRRPRVTCACAVVVEVADTDATSAAT
jgi:hypothetical protein